MDQKKVNAIDHIFPPLASTERGRPSRLAVSKTHLVYCVSNVVVVRSLADLTSCSIFDQHKFETTAVSLSPSGQQCCSGDVKGNVLIWEVNCEGHPVYKQFDDQLGGAIRDIAWTSDGQRICVVGEGKTYFGKAFLVDSGSAVGEISGVSRTLMSCDFRPQRPFRLAVGGDEFSMIWFEGPPFKFKKSSKMHSNSIYALRFSPNGDFLVTVSADKKIFLYDGKSGDLVREIASDQGHGRSITGLAWINETHFVTSGNDTTLKLWNVAGDGNHSTFRIQDPHEIDDMQVGVAALGEDVFSISLSGSLNVFRNALKLPNDFTCSERYHGHIGAVTSMLLGKDILVTGDTKGRILVWKERKASVVRGQTHGKAILGLSLSSQADKLFSLGDEQLKVTNMETLTIEKSVPCAGQTLMLSSSKEKDDVCYVLLGDGVILEFTNMEVTKEIKLGYEVSSFDVGNNLILVGDLKGNIHLLVEGVEQHVFQHLPNRITSIQIQGDKFLMGDSTGKMKLLDIPSKSEIHGQRWSYHSTIISSLTFSASGQFAVSTGQDNKIMVWNLQNGDRVLEIADAHKRGVLTAVIDQNNQIVSSGGDTTIKVWANKIE